MTKKETDELGIEAISKLLKLGLSEQEIGDVLMSSLNITLWEYMTPEQKAEYNNDFQKFCQKTINDMPR